MHRGHDHDHFHPFDLPRAPRGHNQAKATAQWQTPHEPHTEHSGDDHAHEPDFDLVEKAFTEAFPAAKDPTSFLRLTGIPLVAEAGDGTTLSLLRVEQDNVVDIGALSPHLGGESFRYDPLPAAMVSRRESLAFVYFDGDSTRSLSLEEARALAPKSGATR